MIIIIIVMIIITIYIYIYIYTHVFVYVYDHSARTCQVALVRVTSPSFVAYHLPISSYFLIDKGPNLRFRLDKIIPAKIRRAWDCSKNGGKNRIPQNYHLH